MTTILDMRRTLLSLQTTISVIVIDQVMFRTEFSDKIYRFVTILHSIHHPGFYLKLNSTL
jgi:hypothetical protein